MSKLNKTAIAVLVALSSGAVSAGTMGPVCVPGNVTTPCESCGWDVGASALYLEPMYDADFGFYNTTTSTDGSIAFNDFQRDYRWGFEIEGSYHWGTGSDINVNWYHLNAGHNPFDLGPVAIAGGEFTNTTGTVHRSSTWNAVNFEWGQAVRAGYKYWRFHGGAQWAQIKTEDAEAFNSFLTVPAFETLAKSDFNGFGPRGGFDAVYKFCGEPNGFGVYFKTAAAVLAGRSRFDNFSSLPNVVFGGVPVVFGSRTAIVPELEAKLGINYDYNCANGNWTVDLGWMWFNYFNAQTNLARSSLTSVIDSDFGATGPYLRVNYKSNGGFLFS